MMMERVLRWFDIIGERDKLVHVLTWWPSWDGKYLCWPTLLIDQYGYQRCTISPVWDRTRLRLMFKRKRPS